MDVQAVIVPGVGVAACQAGVDNTGYGMVINSSRAILYASKGPDFAHAAHREAVATRDAINAAK